MAPAFSKFAISIAQSYFVFFLQTDSIRPVAQLTLRYCKRPANHTGAVSVRLIFAERVSVGIEALEGRCRFHRDGVTLQRRSGGVHGCPLPWFLVVRSVADASRCPSQCRPRAVPVRPHDLAASFGALIDGRRTWKFVLGCPSGADSFPFPVFYKKSRVRHCPTRGLLAGPDDGYETRTEGQKTGHS